MESSNIVTQGLPVPPTDGTDTPLSTATEQQFGVSGPADLVVSDVSSFVCVCLTRR